MSRKVDIIKERLEHLYDEAANEYRSQCHLFQIPSLTQFAKRLARTNAKTWKERMDWLDIQLKNHGED